MIKDQKDEVPVNFPYADILDHPRHISRLRKPMDISKRAAQFMPFDALTGFDEAMAEVERYKKSLSLADEDEKSELNARLNYLLVHNMPRKEVSVTFARSINGEELGYVTEKVMIKSIVANDHRIVLMDGRSIEFDMLLSIDGDFFNHSEF